MSKLIICFVLLVTSPSLFGSAEDSVEKILTIFNASSKKSNKSNFSVETCKIPQKKLMELALLRQPIKANFKFAKGCDLEGEVELIVSESFPVSLKVRNLDKYTQVKFNSTLSVGSVGEGIGYKVELSDGNLTGKSSSVSFEGVYNYILSLGESKAESVQEGGEVKISSIDGKKVNITRTLGKGKF